MVANALATNQELLAHYAVKTVTTFAAPVNACPNPWVVYHRYVVEGDLVPLVHRAAIWSRLKGPPDVLKSTCPEGYAYLGQTTVDHSPGPQGMENAHSSYEESRDLGQEPLPFPGDRYESKGWFLSGWLLTSWSTAMWLSFPALPTLLVFGEDTLFSLGYFALIAGGVTLGAVAGAWARLGRQTTRS